LGLWMSYSLLRQKRAFRMRSRWMLIVDLGRYLFRRRSRELVEITHDHEHAAAGSAHGHTHPVDSDGGKAIAVKTKTHRHLHSHVLPLPPDPFPSPGVRSALWIGALHGIGAETPTQLLVFLHAASVGGIASGIALLAVFLIGLFVSNMGIAAAAVWGFLSASRNFPLYAAIAAITALLSLGLGSLYLLGLGSLVPAL
jgi:hypothetical protein